VARDTFPETAPSPELSDPAAVVEDDPATTADRRVSWLVAFLRQLADVFAGHMSRDCPNPAQSSGGGY
jgi:hypothetical protein